MQLGRWGQRSLLAFAAAAVGYAIRGAGSPTLTSGGIELAADPIIEVDGVGRLTVFNRAAEQISGYSRDDVLGRHFLAVGILARQSYPVALKHFGLAASGFNPSPAELTIHTKDGQAIVVEGNAQARRVAGVMRSMQVVFRDTTERHESREALQAAKDSIARERRQFVALAESMSAGLLLADPSGTVAYCNSHLTAFTSVPPDVTVGRPLKVLARAMSRRLVDPEEFAHAFEDARTHLEDQPSFDIVVDGDRRRVFEVTCFPVIDVWSEGPGFGALVRDVTAARELDFRKTEFIGVASHELRTPLTGILGFSQLLREHDGLDEEARGWATRIAAEAARLSSIADELLDVSRIDTGSLALEVSAVEIGVVIEDVRSHFSERTADTTHVLQYEIDGVFWAVADTGKLREVLLNLIDNALKYSPAGGTIGVHVGADTDVVWIAVSDHGIGIPAAELSHVFDRFRRVQDRDTASIRGTGLGLYIVDEFVRSMGGSISVDSEPGQGSTFTVRLPRLGTAEAA